MNQLESECYRLHMTKPWLGPDFVRVLIARNPDKPAPRPDKDPYLGDVGGTFDGVRFYEPSMKFWKSHCTRSHPDHGAGCDAQVHWKYLSFENGHAEFWYGNLYEDGTLRLETRKSFRRECAWWTKNSEQFPFRN
jgi:hypothetical protein